jgi:hypothetical protein
MVCRRQDHQQGHVAGYGVGVRRHWYVRGIEDMIRMTDGIWQKLGIPLI